MTGADQHWFNVVAALLALAVVVGGGVAIAAESRAGGSDAAPAAPAAPSADYLYLTIAFNPANGLDEYFPANFSVPARVPVHVVITNFDNGTNPPPASYDRVQGTIGGTASRTDALGASARYSELAGNAIAHTFTVTDGGYGLNVPIPSSLGAAGPTVVSFSAYFNQTGTFPWHCFAPCDPTAMMTPGFMQGTVAVVVD